MDVIEAITCVIVAVIVVVIIVFACIDETLNVMVVVGDGDND